MAAARCRRGHSPSLLHAAFEPPLKEEFARSTLPYTTLSSPPQMLSFSRSLPVIMRACRSTPTNQMGNQRGCVCRRLSSTSSYHLLFFWNSLDTMRPWKSAEALCLMETRALLTTGCYWWGYNKTEVNNKYFILQRMQMPFNTNRSTQLNLW